MEYVEVARCESDRGELVLRERREDGGSRILELRANGVFVMDDAEFTSEQALATAALARVVEPRAVLVAGLGLGFTLHQVLADSRVERCTVVEIEEALVGWMRDGTIPRGQTTLADERVRVVVADIAAAVAEARDASYDLMLLDVDNGPHYLVHEANARVYETAFLEHARRLLRPGGTLVVWSMDLATDLQRVMEKVFDDVEVERHPVRLQDRDEAYWLVAGSVAAEEP